VQRIWRGALPYTTIFGGAVLVGGAAGAIGAILTRDILFLFGTFLALELLRVLLIGAQRLAIRVGPRVSLSRKRRDGHELRGTVRVLDPVLAPYGGGRVAAYCVVEAPLFQNADPDELLRTTEMGRLMLEVEDDLIELRGPFELLGAPLCEGLLVIREGDVIRACGRLEHAARDVSVNYRRNRWSHVLGPDGTEPLLIQRIRA
jgi:hypothetical protein